MRNNRRNFLKSAAAATAGVTLFGIKAGHASPPYVRKDVGPMTASSPALVSYGKAITAMQALPATNPLSWAYQAAIHGTMSSGSHPAWNTCEHGTLEFLSWHRMYLYWFERIIRKMSGDPKFALPFWNYEASTERYLPVPFRSPGTGLYVADGDRGSGWNDGTSYLLASAVSTAGCMPEKPYDTFSGNLEGTPHASVHNSFGFTGGWMGSIETAAQDPIFFLHHCNIDRIWNAWLAQGAGRTDPLGDTDWTTKKFTFFDESGNEVTMTGCDILRAQEQLGYSYQGEPAQVKQYCVRRLPWWVYIHEILVKWPPIKWPPGPDPGPVEIDLREVRQRLGASLTAKNAGVVLRLDGVTADRQPNVYWEVYVGLPAGERASVESPHYVGNLAIFGGGVSGAHGGHAAKRAAGVTFSLNRALRASLARANTAGLSLQFVARGAGGKLAAETRNKAEIQIGEAVIAVRQLKEQKGG